MPHQFYNNNSILNKPFLLLLGLLLLALVIQFSIMFVWFDRGHYEVHDALVLEFNIPVVNNAAAVVAAVDSRSQQKSSLLRHGDIIPKMNNMDVFNEKFDNHYLLKHEGDVSSSSGHNTNRTAVLAAVKKAKAVAVEPDPPRHGSSEEKRNQILARRQHFLDYEVNKNKNEVLNAVIHIGPYKTATTAIQTYSSKLVKLLAQDGYEMPWSFLKKEISKGSGNRYKIKNVASWWCKQLMFATCFFQNVPTNRMREESADMCEPDIYDAGIEIVQRNRNSLLVSAEQFSNTEIEGVEALQEYLSNRWDNVTIVAAYRRYYEWIVSFYNERYKHVELYDAVHANATDRLFPSLYHELHFNHHFNDAIQHTYTLSAVARFKKHFRHVVVMNYHDKSKSLLERFYCDVVPNAHNTCRRLKTMKETNKKINTSHNRIYEELAYAAHRRGMINIQSKQKAKLAEVLMHQHQEKTLNLTSDDFPRKCLPEDILQDIWSTTFEAEKEFGGEVDDSMKDEFEKYSKTSFCEVDLDAVLDSSLWVEFLKGFQVELERRSVEKKNRRADIHH